MRLEESEQICVSAVGEQDGNPYLWITEVPDEQLPKDPTGTRRHRKGASSRRLVPIHPKPVEVRFLDRRGETGPQYRRG